MQLDKCSLPAQPSLAQPTAQSLVVQGYKKAGVTDKAKAALRQGTDYMLKCNLPASFGSDFAYVAQVSKSSRPCSHDMGSPSHPTIQAAMLLRVLSCMPAAQAAAFLLSGCMADAA